MVVRLEIGQDSNGSPIHTLYIDDKEVECIRDLGESPEDAHIGRDLLDGNDIIKYIKMGYQAADGGRELFIEYINT